MKTIGLILLAITAISPAAATTAKVITVPPVNGDATSTLQSALDSAANHAGGAVEIRLSPGDYHLSRNMATKRIYHVSNTASVDENPDPTKHIGMLLKHMRNIIIDGNGARIITHGEMTTWVIDSCENISLRNMTVTSGDPSVPEMTVTSVTDSTMTATVTPPSEYTISDNGVLVWHGDGWTINGGIAQIHDPVRGVTLRCGSPIVEARKVEELTKGKLLFHFDKLPLEARPGNTYQMRHSIRNEVAGLIDRSRNITLENLQLQFLGNFGIVAQYSENITYRSVTCAPDGGSGRTCAGFADFMQLSGCRGKVTIADCRFAGSHDDPINIHGTHLRATEWMDENRVTVRFMHPQTFGFPAFAPDDEVELVDPQSLLPMMPAKVTAASMISPYEMSLELDRSVPERIRQTEGLVLENVTWTPEVSITGCRFTLTPTRGILVSTRRKVEISGNEFLRIPMSAILIADDARSWFESGPVDGVTITGNSFIECSTPVILIQPEYSRFDGSVHRNIAITGNQFTGTYEKTVSARGVDGLEVSHNTFILSSGSQPHSGTPVETTDCINVQVGDNLTVD